MAVTDTGLVKAHQLFTENGGMLRTSKAIRLGIHPRTLYALRDAGEIETGRPWTLQTRDGTALSSPDLVPIAIRIPGVEAPRIQVTLATGIPEEHCRRLNLGYRDPATVHPEEWAKEGWFVAPHDGEMLYRVRP